MLRPVRIFAFRPLRKVILIVALPWHLNVFISWVIHNYHNELLDVHWQNLSYNCLRGLTLTNGKWITRNGVVKDKKKKWNNLALQSSQSTCIYSQLSLSWLRLSRITAYLEEKILSLFYYRNLKSGYKILWKRGEIAPREQFLPFSTIFSIYISNCERSQII